LRAQSNSGHQRAHHGGNSSGDATEPLWPERPVSEPVYRKSHLREAGL
jgi:hypothetical protein